MTPYLKPEIEKLLPLYWGKYIFKRMDIKTKNHYHYIKKYLRKQS